MVQALGKKQALGAPAFPTATPLSLFISKRRPRKFLQLERFENCF
jgi:hypothetical protein